MQCCLLSSCCTPLHLMAPMRNMNPGGCKHVHLYLGIKSALVAASLLLLLVKDTPSDAFSIAPVIAHPRCRASSDASFNRHPQGYQHHHNNGHQRNKRMSMQSSPAVDEQVWNILAAAALTPVARGWLVLSLLLTFMFPRFHVLLLLLSYYW